jgi:hypothetical protein
VDKLDFVHNIKRLRGLKAGALTLYVPDGKNEQHLDLCENAVFPTFRTCGYANAYPQPVELHHLVSFP